MFFSHFDLTSEKDYHAILLTLSFSLQDTHLVHSNREVGLGRSDLVLPPKPTSGSNLGIVLEFKREQTEKDLDVYRNLASKGLKQIEDKRYDLELKQNPIVQRILKLCLVFHGKKVAYQYTMENV